MYYAGIDPGLSGAITILTRSQIISIYTMPLTETRDLDLKQIKNILTPYYHSLHVVIEQQIPMQGQGVSSTFKTGLNYGKLLGLLSALDIPKTIVSSVKWKNVVIGKDRPKDIDKKIVSLNRAKELFQDQTFLATRRSTKPHDGMFESALIAYYGEMIHEKQNRPLSA